MSFFLELLHFIAFFTSFITLIFAICLASGFTISPTIISATSKLTTSANIAALFTPSTSYSYLG